jgi:hypothetical protein
VSLRIVTRVAMPVRVDVPGRRDGTIVLDGLSASPSGGGVLRSLVGLPSAVSVRFSARDAGNIHYEALNGRVDLVAGARIIASSPVRLGTMLPGDSRDVAVRLDLPAYPVGDYRVRVSLEASPAVSTSLSLGVSPLRLYVIGGSVVAVLIAGVLLLWRRFGTGRRRGPRPAASAPRGPARASGFAPVPADRPPSGRRRR